MLCEGLILSKKGFGEGHLSINFLDSKRGKLRVAAYGAALETGKRRANIASGAFIEGLITKKNDRYVLSDVKSILTIDHIRAELKPMGFAFFTLEILDMMLLEEDIFDYYKDLFDSFQLFDQTLDEKFVLFFLAKFLGNDSWLNIPEYEKLSKPSQIFIRDAMQNPVQFLQGKSISLSRRHNMAYLFAHAVKRARYRMPNSLELLRFGE